MQESLSGNRRHAADGITLCKDGTAWTKYIEHPARCDSTYSISLPWLTLSVQGSELGAVGSGWIGPLLMLTLYSWGFLQLSLFGRLSPSWVRWNKDCHRRTFSVYITQEVKS